MPEEKHTESVDIVIIGAGMVGLSLACALAAENLRIAIIDRAKLADKNQWQGRDARVSAIVKSSEHFLNNIGAWPWLEKEAHCAYHRMEVWERDGTAAIEFDSEDIGYSELGYIIENRVMQWALTQQLQAFDNVCWYCPDSVASMQLASQNTHKQWQVQLESGKQVLADLLIGADGAMSFVREQLNIDVDVKDLEHKAIVCNLNCELPHNNTARQIFLPTGPLAFLPLAGDAHLCSIVWSCEHQRADELMAMSEQEFNEQLAIHFEERLGKVPQSDKRFCFPLYQRHAKHYISKQAALIGDAAHTIHPLAGQGVNLGYMDAAVLAEEILRAKQRGLAIGSREVLRRYERRRRGQVSLMMHTMRGFQQLFAIHNADMIGLRNLGVRLTNRATPVKHHLLSRAMGIAGDVPDIARQR